jgi:hypothetical protein
VVFGLLKRGDCGCTEIVPDASKGTVRAVIRGKTDVVNVIDTDGWGCYLHALNARKSVQGAARWNRGGLSRWYPYTFTHTLSFLWRKSS